MKFVVVKKFLDADFKKGVVGKTIEADEKSVKHLLDAGFIKPENEKEESSVKEEIEETKEQKKKGK